MSQILLIDIANGGIGVEPAITQRQANAVATEKIAAFRWYDERFWVLRFTGQRLQWIPLTGGGYPIDVRPEEKA